MWYLAVKLTARHYAPGWNVPFQCNFFVLSYQSLDLQTNMAELLRHIVAMGYMNNSTIHKQR